MARILWFVIAVALSCSSCRQSALYKNPSAPLDRRVEDLLSRMTLEEKVSQLTNDSAAIERLDVPAYNWWNECLHGVARAGRATVFPQAIGLAATWDTNLMFRVATAISDEARAKHHEFARRGKRAIYQGLTFWTPNINLFRDPRWGRGMETYGEDPYLTGRMAVQFVKGLQGDDPKYLKVIATAKHYAVHSGPESTRHTFDARVDERDLRDTYLPQFEAAVKEGGAYSVMCAYNRVDGEPACSSALLLAEILRKEWGFTGYVVSDCGAIGDIYLNHKVAPTAEAGVSRAVKAGCDLNCGVEYSNLPSAVKQGLISVPEIDGALRRLLVARFKLGMFDPPEMVRYARIPYSVNDSQAHGALALDAARKSIVLLKNQGGLLPLRKDLNTIAVIGPNANDPEVMLGNYNGNPSEPVTPLEGIRRKLPQQTRVIYARGADLAANMPALETVPASALFTSDGPGRKGGLNAEYFNTSNFNGKAYRPRELTYPHSGVMVGEIPAASKPLFSRVDPTIDFNWWDGAPRGDMNDDNFGVRWSGFLLPPVSGTYQLGAVGLNAFEVYLDGKLLAEYNDIHQPSYVYGPVELEAGKMYPIRVEFHETINDASIRLVWRQPGGSEGQRAVEVAKQADAVVMVLGLSGRLEGEEMRVPVEGFQGGDRVQIGLPRAQEDLLRRIVALGKPVVLVLMNGSALAVGWARENVPAIVEAWYPGQDGGTALADVLFGDYNPAGRLPVTFYQSEKQLPPFEDYNMKGRTYRYFTGEPLYPFGFGLSYTQFTYRNLALPPEARTAKDVKVAVEVENSGKLAGEEVVQLYLKHLGASVPAPIRSLEGFQRVALQPGERKTIEFTLSPRQLSVIGKDNARRVEPGVFEVSIGGKQPGFRGAADASTTGVLTRRFRLIGD
jgi:beta-glucosidase